MADKEIFQLEDIDVDTLGIVTRGANDQTFFLLKSEAKQMTDELVIEQVESTQPDSDSSFINKVETWFKGVIAKAKKTDSKAVAQAAQVLQQGGYDVETADLAEMLAGMMEEEMEEDEVEMEDKKPMKKDDEVIKNEPTTSDNSMAALEAIQKAHLDAIQKAHEAQMEAVIKSMAEKYETQLTTLAERVEKAETERTQAEDKRQEREYIEKAQNFRALPLSYVEVGQMLYTLAKSVETAEFEKWYSLLKSVDHQLGAAGIFAEMGTSRTPEQVAIEDKVIKATDPVAAMLNLSEAEQIELLDAMRGGK